MNPPEEWKLRWRLLSELVARSPGRLGRTALMKLAYLLQTVKGVPLGYDFRLYTYGPFDSDVLNDLGQLESLGAVKSQSVMYPSGYGFEFSKGVRQDSLWKLAGKCSTEYENAITWALAEFGNKSAGDLELLSTIVYTDREIAQRRHTVSFEQLAAKVKEVKQKFPESFILEKVRDLANRGLLESCLAG